MAKIEKLKTLFDSDEEEVGGFETNEKYAKHYNEFRKKEILSHVKNLEESSTDDDASTDEELVNPEFDEEFFKTMAFLKNKDPTKYQKIPSFFENIEPVEDVVRAKQKKGEKILTVADHQRERLIKTGGVMSDDEESHPADLTYSAEQEKIRNDLKKALNDSDVSEDESNFFKVREKTDEEIKSEQIDFEKWLSTQSSKEIKPLKDFWTNNTLSKEDKFLRDYILKQKYIRKDNENYDEVQDFVGLSDDEVEVEKQTEYEQKYNFRFEQPDEEFIKRFPRNIDDTVRAENTKRKEKRKEREERKLKEKELKMKELREVQNIRKREIEEKLLLLKDVAGNDNLHEILQEDDLNSDFDPNEHDKRMSKIFNDEYYGIDEGDQKPEFPDIDQELAVENWDNFDLNKVSNGDTQHCEDDDFVMDCDYDPEEEKKRKLQSELIDMSKGRKRKKKTSKLAELIKREKPAYDPSNDKTYAEYLEEYYALDYEDIIGDQPCRFKYSECVPNDFGLTVEEILMASNKELNQWASLKKTMQNRPKNVELNDVEKYNRMRSNVDLKKKIFKSMYGEQNENEPASESESDPKPEKTEVKPNEVKAASKTKKKKKKKTTTVTSQSIDNQNLNKTKEVKPIEVKVTPQNIVNKNPGPQSNTKSNKRKLEEPKLEEKPSTAKKTKLSEKPSKDLKAQQVDIKRSPKLKKLKMSNSVNNQSNSGTTSNQFKNGVSIVQFKQRGFKKTNQNSLGGNKIGDNRLKAFGINPKKFKSKMKYGGKNQKKN